MYMGRTWRAYRGDVGDWLSAACCEGEKPSVLTSGDGCADADVVDARRDEPAVAVASGEATRSDDDVAGVRSMPGWCWRGAGGWP
jgi:hypothetical protein